MEVVKNEAEGSKHLRLGSREEQSGEGGGLKMFELPGCILYTRCGMVPHLTADNLKLITNIPLKVAQLPVSTVLVQPGVEVMEKYRQHLQRQGNDTVEQHEEQQSHIQREQKPGLPEQQQQQHPTSHGAFHTFSNTVDTTWLLNVHDTHVTTRHDMYKYNDDKSVSVWSPGGRKGVSPQQYMNMVEVFGMDVALAPSDSIPEVKSKKRCQKSCDRTTRFVDECLRIREERGLKNPLLASVEGGDVLKSREYSAKQLGVRNVDGYMIGGLSAPHEDWKNLLQASLKHLPPEKVKFMLGVLTPHEIVEAVQCGVDVFDSVIAHHAADRGCALSFDFNQHHQNNRTKHNSQNIPLPESDQKCEGNNNADILSESVPKKMKTDVEESKEREFYAKDLTRYEMNLTDRMYFDDDRALVEGCNCYTCTHHVRAYLHHLLVTKEMLAPVLLTIHNITHWFGFMEEVRRCRREGTLEQLKVIVGGDV